MTLYRKYRPLTFSDLVGQDDIRMILQNALSKERIAHAYLFSGPRGTGKTSTARIFARALSCLEPKRTDGKSATYEPCNQCARCQMILEGETSDILEIDAASNRGVEEIRTLREQVHYPPVYLPRKVYIIDEAHMLTGEAFNALLKTLEEPPAHCLFILATTEAHKVPLTVRSRCQLIRFQQGSPESIAHKLDKIIKKEGWEVEKGVTNLIARHAEGGFRDAETLLEQIAVRDTTIKLEKVRELLGELEATLCELLVDSCLLQDLKNTETILQKDFSDSTLRYERIITELIRIVRSKPLTSLSIYFLEQLLEAYIVLRYSPTPHLPLHIACLNTCSRSPIQPAAVKMGESVSYDTSMGVIHEPKSQKEKITNSLNTVSPRGTQTQGTPSPEDPPYTGDIRKAWKTAVTDIKESNHLLAQTLREADFHSAENNTITIHVRYKFHLEKLNEPKNMRSLQKRLEELTNIKWTIVYCLKSALPKKDASPASNTASPLEKEVAAVFTAAPKPQQKE